MATDLCSTETPPVTSPRISFSHNLSQSDINHQRLLSRPASSSSSVDFDFCIRQSNVDKSSSAEELFSDGIILPIDPNVKQDEPLTTLPPVQPRVETHALKCDQDSNETVVSVLSESHDRVNHAVESQEPNETEVSVLSESHDRVNHAVKTHALKRDQDSNKTMLSVLLESHDQVNHLVETHALKCDQDSNETEVSVLSESHDLKQKSARSSFWQFKRSSSLNCGSGYARTLCPIPLLSRSHSTGSASSSNKSPSSSKEFHPNLKQHAQKKNSVPVVAIKQSNPSPSKGHQKIPLKKSGYGGNGNGSVHGNGNSIRVNPVLNVSSANLFGLGSIFSGNKEKNKKK